MKEHPASQDKKLAGAVWSTTHLGELLEALTKVSKLRGAVSVAQGRVLPANAPPPAADTASLSLFLDWICQHLACEAEPASVSYDEVAELLARAAPAVLHSRLEPLVDGGETATGDGVVGYLALVESRRGRALLLAPSGKTIAFPIDELRSHLCTEIEARHDDEVDRLLRTTEVRGARRDKARRVLLARRLGDTPLRGIWLLRERSSLPFARRLLRTGIGSRLAALAAAHFLQTALWIAAWWLVGKAFLQGNLPEGWLTAWLLLLGTLVPLRLLATWLQGELAIRAGAATKQRLYAGALKLAPDEVRTRGVGQLMGSVLESEAVEAQALNGGFLALLGGIELLFAFAVLGMGAARFGHPLCLAASLATTVVLAWSYHRERRSWTGDRLAMTHTLIEKIVGHRTRMVQESPADRHREEDQSLDAYAATSRRLDGRAILLTGLLPRAWLLLSLAALVPAFVAGATTSSLAIALGGVLLAYRALARTATGLTSLADGGISWRRVKPMFEAASIDQPASSTPPCPVAASGNAKLLETRKLRYTYPGRGESVLDGCNLEIKRGEQVLLTGTSGSGKSTLISILSGLRAGQDGLTLLEGRDEKSTGTATWRAKVGTALQLHDNHLFSAPFLFNLAAGNGWPPSPRDIRNALGVCRDLNLDALLERMPGRFNQVVGECGWRLSHGEKARLCMARALLRNPELLLADEAFGALDCHTQRRALDAARLRVPTLVLVGHG